MLAQLDQEGYYTGNYAITGSLPGNVEVDSLPTETDRLKLLAYKLTDGSWIYDTDKHDSLVMAQKAEEKKQEIRGQITHLESEIAEIDSKITLCANYMLLELALPYDTKILLTAKTDKQNQISELQTQLS